MAGGRLVGYSQSVTEGDLNSGLSKNSASGMVEAFNPGPPDYNTSAPNHSATLPPPSNVTKTLK